MVPVNHLEHLIPPRMAPCVEEILSVQIKACVLVLKDTKEILICQMDVKVNFLIIS